MTCHYNFHCTWTLESEMFERSFQRNEVSRKDYDHRWKWLGTRLILIHALKNFFRPQRKLSKGLFQKKQWYFGCGEWNIKIWNKKIDKGLISTKIFDLTFQALFLCSTEGLMLKTSSASQFTLGHAVISPLSTCLIPNLSVIVTMGSQFVLVFCKATINFTVLSAWEVKLRGQPMTITLYISQHKQMLKLCQSMRGHFVMLYMMQITFKPGHAYLWIYS